MKIQSAGKWVVQSAIIAGALVFQCGAQDSQGGAAATAVVASKNNDSVAEVLKLLDAKVSKDVIKAYIEGSSGAWNPTAADIIALKEHGAPDDITTALLKRGVEVKTQAVQAATEVAAKPAANSGDFSSSRYMDPESYDYFAQYYLYPRTLASVNQRLGYYMTPYPYGAYGGVYPAMPYGPNYGQYYNNFGFRGPIQPMVRNGHVR
jgi:hypothetical protein